jgi:integrase/recombinase XerD
MTFLEGVTELLAYMRLDGYSRASLRVYSQQLDPFCAWLRRQRIRDLRGVSRAQLLAYQLHIRSQPVGLVTQGLRIRVVKRLYAHLVAEGHLLLDPTEGIASIARIKALPRSVLTPAEMQRLMGAPDVSKPVGIRDRAWLEVLYATGARVGELEGIELRDLDWTQGTVQLRRTKGGMPRVVPLGRHAMEWLQQYLDAARPAFVAQNPFETILFVASTGRPLEQEQLRHRLKRYVRLAGIRKAVSPHLLRHSCATHLLRAGADLRVIQELLGHKSLSSTVLYTRVAPLDVKASHERYHPGNRHAGR